MADFQLHEQVRTVRFADGTTELWRVFIDPDSGVEVDRHPVVRCRDCGEELRSSWSGRCLRCHESRLLRPEQWGWDVPHRWDPSRLALYSSNRPPQLP